MVGKTLQMFPAMKKEKKEKRKKERKKKEIKKGESLAIIYKFQVCGTLA